MNKIRKWEISYIHPPTILNSSRRSCPDLNPEIYPNTHFEFCFPWWFSDVYHNLMFVVISDILSEIKALEICRSVVNLVLQGLCTSHSLQGIEAFLFVKTTISYSFLLDRWHFNNSMLAVELGYRSTLVSISFGVTLKDVDVWDNVWIST